jgi:hypothetical protein
MGNFVQLEDAGDVAGLMQLLNLAVILFQSQALWFHIIYYASIAALTLVITWQARGLVLGDERG